MSYNNPEFGEGAEITNRRLSVVNTAADLLIKTGSIYGYEEPAKQQFADQVQAAFNPVQPEAAAPQVPITDNSNVIDMTSRRAQQLAVSASDMNTADNPLFAGVDVPQPLTPQEDDYVQKIA